MEPVLYIMAIMGCGDGAFQCAEARVARAQFTSVQACQAAMPDMLQRSTDLPFPEIAATCRRVTPVMADARKGARRGS